MDTLELSKIILHVVKVSLTLNDFCQLLLQLSKWYLTLTHLVSALARQIMNLLLVWAHHLPSLEQSWPLSRILIWSWAPKQDFSWLDLVIERNFRHFVAHTLMKISSIFLFQVIDIDKIGEALFMLHDCLSSISFLSRFDRNVSWRAIRFLAIVRDLVVPSFSLHHICLQLCQAILVLVIHESGSEQVLHAAFLLVLFRSLTLMPPMERVVEAVGHHALASFCASEGGLAWQTVIIERVNLLRLVAHHLIKWGSRHVSAAQRLRELTVATMGLVELRFWPLLPNVDVLGG